MGYIDWSEQFYTA